MSDSPWQVQIVRSARRSKTLSARLVGEHSVEVRVPLGMPQEREREIVGRLVERVKARVARAERLGDGDLMARAQELNRRYFGGKLQVTSVRYVSNQNTRFGSCTPSSAAIRLSQRLAKTPQWVRDYVLVHELAHLVEPNHSPRFWQLVHQYPRTERAIGFLMALGLSEEGENADDREYETENENQKDTKAPRN